MNMNVSGVLFTAQAAARIVERTGTAGAWLIKSVSILSPGYIEA